MARKCLLFHKWVLKNVVHGVKVYRCSKCGDFQMKKENA